MTFLEKYKNASVSLKATIFFGISAFAISGINYIFTPVFTRLLTTAEYGEVVIYNSWYLILQVVLTLTLTNPGIVNVGLYEHADNRWRYLSTIMGLITVNAAFFGGIYLLLRDKINELLGLPTSLMLLIIANCMLLPATALWTAKQKYEYDYKITFFVTVGSAVAAQLFSVVAVYLFQGSGKDLAAVKLWSAGAVNLVTALVIYLHIFRKGKVFFDRSIWKATVLVAVPLIPHYLSSVVLTSSDKIMIGQMIGDDVAGIYGLAATLSSIGVLFWRALAISFNPFINAKLGERDFQTTRETVKPLWLFTGAFCVIGSLLAPEVVRVFATKEYLSGVYVVPPIVAGIFIHALYSAFAAIAFFHKKSVNIMIASVVSALVNIIMNYFAIRQFGFIAAGYTTLIANLILTGMHYWNMRRIEKESVYDARYIFILVVLVVTACLLCNVLYPLPSFIRYLLAGAILLYLYLKRSKLIRALSDMKV